ncbi:hypothetical protein DNTS_020723 [Danionella cerebrum]|uniref:FYVE, RhoGEF and PH domain-containing protein 5 n=1 Tax=Danionella cerebrum TaxID=2873325 RepID=A0A553MP58_9TELE|nr:hypothetical protein DNTS_020723 [Danionella translucida]
MSAEIQKHPLSSRPLFQSQYPPSTHQEKESSHYQETKLKTATKPTKYLQDHHPTAKMYFSMLQKNKSPPNSRGLFSEMHRKIVLEQEASLERKTDTKTSLEKRIQIDETEVDVVLEQADEIGCGDELAQGVDLDLVEGFEGDKPFVSDAIEVSIDCCSDLWWKKEVDDGVDAEHKQEEDTRKVAWGMTKNVKNMCFQFRSEKEIIEAFYPNGEGRDRRFSSEDLDGMYPDICDGGEALADQDGLSECDLFEQTESLEIITQGNASGDVLMLSMEDKSNNPDLSSTSDEENNETQIEIELTEKMANKKAEVDSLESHPSGCRGEAHTESDHQLSFSISSSLTFLASDDDVVVDANHSFSCDNVEAKNGILNLSDINSLPLVKLETPDKNSLQNQHEDFFREENGGKVNAVDIFGVSEVKEPIVDHLYEETEPQIQSKDYLQDRKYFMCRSISVETPSKRVDLTSSPLTGNKRLLLHPGSFYTDQCFLGDNRPALTGSLGCLSQGTHSSNLMKVSQVDIPPPFELASITKRPIRKSSPAIPNEISASCKKPDFGLKRYLLPLRFLKKSDRKTVTDSRSVSSRSSSESSPQGSCKRLDFIRNNMGSPELQRSPNCTPPVSPSSFLLHRSRQKEALNLSLHKNLACSFLSIDHSPLFETVPSFKPRSFSSPNTDSSEYENVQNAASHYENVQIRLLNPVIQSPRNQSSASDTDGYVDMSSLPGFQTHSSEQETDSLYTFCSPNVRADGTMGVSVGMPCTQENNTKAPEKLSASCSRAFYSAKELLDSEAQHVKALQHLCESVNANERLTNVWTELPDICSLHQKIHTSLEAHIKEWGQTEGIAEIILAKKADFTIYSSYISHYDEKMNYLEHIQSTLSDGLILKKQLLQVIVRILQYRMLLTDYLNNLSPDSKEFENTQDALVVVSDIVYQVNDSLKNGVDLLRLVNIEHSILGLNDLLQPGRVFVKEGTLMKVSRKCKQPRHLFLMNDIMLYTYPQQDGKYRLINRLSLAGMKIKGCRFVAVISGSDFNCLFRSSISSCIERDNWFVTLNRALVDLSSSSGVAMNPPEPLEAPEMCLGENAPPLLSASQVTECMNCPSHFTLTNRRHHCHACGKVVCRDCCRNKFPLKYLKNRRAKVCDHCYSELRKDDVGTVVQSSSRPLSTVFHNIHPSSLWKSRKGQLSFHQVTGSDGVMSGTLQRSKNSKRSWRSLWFLLKDKVLYTYPQPEERVACETLPLLGFSVRSEAEGESSVFQLYHKSTLFYTFRAQDSHTAQRWVNAMEEATVL